MDRLYTPTLPDLLTRPGRIAAPAAPAARSAVEVAQACNATLARITAEIRRDTGLSAEDLTGTSTYQPDLPFFMQPGFDK